MFARLSDYGISCSHPKRVFNKYTKEWITVPCRSCAACNKVASNRLISMISNASKSAAITYFITLTYSPENLPSVTFSSDVANHIDGYDIQNYDYKTRLPEIHHYDDDVYLNAIDTHFFNLGMPSLSDSSFLGKGKFGVLVKSDIQKFFKRFRKLLSYAFPQTVVKYFCVGEYGSQTFRPHYHIALFASDVLPSDKVSSLVNLAWKVGRIDCQVAKGSVASYLGAYLSGFSPLPVFLTLKPFKPFYLHSSFSSYTLSFEEEKKLFESAYNERSSYLIESTSKGYTSVPFPKSVRDRLFPKCSRFMQRSDTALLYFLCRYENEVIKQKTPFPLFCVDTIKDDIALDFGVGQRTYCNNRVFGKSLLSLSDIRDAYKLPSSDKKDKCISLVDKTVYVDIYASYKVWKIAQLLHTSSYFVAKRIIEFYKGSETDEGSNYSLQMLKRQYQAFELCSNKDEVKFLYSFFNGRNKADALSSVGLDSNINQCVIDAFNNIVANTNIQAIKHKDRNSYNLYKLHHK